MGGFGGRKEKKETASSEWSQRKNTSRGRPPTQKLIAYISDAPWARHAFVGSVDYVTNPNLAM